MVGLLILRLRGVSACICGCRAGSGRRSRHAFPTEDGTYEVIAPSSREARDFRPRVAELLRTLAIAEDRSELDVFRDLTRVQFDIQYTHIHTHFTAPLVVAPLREVAAARAMPDDPIAGRASRRRFRCRPGDALRIDRVT